MTQITAREHMRLGWFSERQINEFLKKAAALPNPLLRIEFISRQFLGVPYQESTLIGSSQKDEELVINLEAMDCFTYIDYIEALRRSQSFQEFRKALVRVRYRRGMVTFRSRRHFFTDWAAGRVMNNLTRQIGRGEIISVAKHLNQRNDGTTLIPGVPVVERRIDYIPSTALASRVTEALQTGDYAGVYSEADGLDVSHVGIVVKDDEMLFLRHASQLQRKVVDQEFWQYFSKRPGLIVLRPRT
jgi:hypothetical protein